MAQEGAVVVISDINDEAGDALAASIRSANGQAVYHHADIGESAEVEALMACAVERFGRIDILVNNAAVAIPGKVAEMPEEAWNKVLNINLSSVYRGMRYAIPHMIEHGGGSIVNMSSAQGLIGFSGWSAYAAAKGGINALTRQAAVDYSQYNIRINAVAPGTINTAMNVRIFAEHEDGEALKDYWTSRHVAGRFGEPEEVAGLIVFLASDAASFITGEIIRIDGGLVINGG
jgi:NAD(P)-dependent dehydrogenase (short-subunit alcohol dehydrogenase family)